MTTTLDDAVTAVTGFGDARFQEGADSRQAEVDDLKAKLDAATKPPPPPPPPPPPADSLLVGWSMSKNPHPGVCGVSRVYDPADLGEIDKAVNVHNSTTRRCTWPRSSTTPPASSWPSSAGSTRSSPDGCFRLLGLPVGLVPQRGDLPDRPLPAGRSASRSASRCGPSRSRSTSPAQEMLITAPELNHLRPVTDKVEHLFRTTGSGREMLPKPAGNGINHQPQFQAHFVNNARIVSRLPNRDGKRRQGHAPAGHRDGRGQDYPDNGWIELIETMKAGSPGAQWRCHGVSRGVRDRYYKYTMGEDPDLPFYVHRYMAMHRPSWSAGGAQGQDRDLRRHRRQHRLPPQHLRRARRRHQPGVRAAPADGLRPDPGVQLGHRVQRRRLRPDQDQRRAAPRLRRPDRERSCSSPAPTWTRLLLVLGRHGRRLHPRPVRDPGLRRDQHPKSTSTPTCCGCWPGST
jgi:hypothetical protein